MRTRVYQATFLKASIYYSLLKYLTGFGVARGLLIVSPILLANLLSRQTYGMLEFSQSIASISALFIGMGTASLVPLIKICNIETAAWESILLHHLLCSTALAIIGFILLNLNVLQVVFGFTCLCTSALLLQGFWSVVLKSKGYAELSLLIDAGFWIWVMLIVCLVIYSSLSSSDLNQALVKGLIVYNALLIGITGKFYLNVKSQKAISGYGMTLRSSLPLMLSGIMSCLVSSAGRWGIGLISTLALTAEYNILYRVTSLSIIVHQLALVRLFPRLFNSTYETLDKLLASIACLVGLSILIFWVLIDQVAWIFGPAFLIEFSERRVEGGLILLQSILWSAIALNETVCLRSQIAGSLARIGALYLLIALPLVGFYLYGREGTLIQFIIAHSMFMLGYFFVQIIAIYRHGIYMLRTWWLVLGVYFLFCAIMWLYACRYEWLIYH